MGSEIIKRGYSTTHYGRRRYLTYPKSPVGIFPWLYNKKISKAKRQGINQIIQGDAAEILKLAMLDMFHDNPFGWEKFRMLLQVHDELVLEVHDSLVETYYEDGEEKFRLNADAKTFVDKCMLKPANYFLNRVPIEYNSKVDKVWIK
jgi:DNA polymerase-1